MTEQQEYEQNKERLRSLPPASIGRLLETCLDFDAAGRFPLGRYAPRPYLAALIDSILERPSRAE